MGAPRVRIIERNNAAKLSSARGVNAGIVIDSARGDVEKLNLSTSPEKYLESIGGLNPLAFGIAAYSGLNFLTNGGTLYWARVNRGQTYASMLVRSKVDAIKDTDEFGFLMENPSVDKIIHPAGPLAKAELDSFQFTQYARSRVVDSFSPVVSLTNAPIVGQQKVYVDNIGPLNVGRRVAFKDTTGLPASEVSSYDTYMVQAIEKVQVNQHFIELDSPLEALTEGTAILRVVESKTAFSTPAIVAAPAALGDTSVQILSSSSAQPGDRIGLAGQAVSYTLGSFTPGVLYAENAQGVRATGTSGSNVVTLSALLTLAPNAKIKLGAQNLEVLSVSGSNVTLKSNLDTSVSNVLVELGTDTKVFALDTLDGLGYALSTGQHLLKAIAQSLPFSTAVSGISLDILDPTRIQVSGNDPVSEGDIIDIAGSKREVLTKTTLSNFVNEVTLSSTYKNQNSVVSGSELFHVVESDYEYRDCGLIYAKDPGAKGSEISVAIRPHKVYSDAFYLDVYLKGVSVETFEVSRKHRLNGFSRQMFWESVINLGSRYIRVVDNSQHLDSNGEPILPLFTTYYIKQAAPTPLFTEVAQAVETLRDGDNLIRIDPEQVEAININVKAKIGSREYVIASLAASAVGGPLDTLVLESGLQLGMEALPKPARFLPVGTQISQQVASLQKVRFSVNEPTSPAGRTHAITIEGTQYTYVAQANDTADTIFAALAASINPGNSRVIATTIVVEGVKHLDVRSKLPGVPFTYLAGQFLTAAIKTANSRQWDYKAPVRVDNAIVPNLEINKLLTLAEGSLYIRDAGANHATGGWDGNYPTVGQYILGANKFKSRDKVDIHVFMDGGITYPAYQKAITEVVENRGDCMGFLSVPYEVAASPDIQNVVNYRRNELAVDSSYMALFSPWVEVYDPYTDTQIWVPIESDAASNVSTNSENDEIWTPIAGWTYGKINRALSVSYEYDSEERDLLYDNQINPVKVDPKGRKAIFGQKTLQIEDSPTNRINARYSLIAIGRALATYLEEQLFKVNDEDERRRHKLNADSFMRDFKTRKAVYDFLTQCDAENNPNEVIESSEMYLDIGVKTHFLAEYIYGRITINRRGASFQVTPDSNI